MSFTGVVSHKFVALAKAEGPFCTSLGNAPGNIAEQNQGLKESVEKSVLLKGTASAVPQVLRS
jgi:hypothetical protein